MNNSIVLGSESKCEILNPCVAPTVFLLTPMNFLFVFALRFKWIGKNVHILLNTTKWIIYAINNDKLRNFTFPIYLMPFITGDELLRLTVV